MLRKFPKDDGHFRWTNHIKNKMLYYNLSEQRIKRVFRAPKRREEGIAPGTMAAMQSSVTKKKPEEIWVMYQLRRSPGRGGRSPDPKASGDSKVLMISAWRYPGVSKPGTPIPIPEDIAAELEMVA